MVRDVATSDQLERTQCRGGVDAVRERVLHPNGFVLGARPVVKVRNVHVAVRGCPSVKWDAEGCQKNANRFQGGQKFFLRAFQRRPKAATWPSWPPLKRAW